MGSPNQLIEHRKIGVGVRDGTTGEVALEIDLLADAVRAEKAMGAGQLLQHVPAEHEAVAAHHLLGFALTTKTFQDFEFGEPAEAMRENAPAQRDLLVALADPFA